MRSLAVITVMSATAFAQPAPKPAPIKMPEQKPPVGAVVIPCTVQAELQAVVSSTNVALRVVLKNIGRTAAKVSLGSICGARYTILGEPANTCPPSPCRAAPVETITIGANRSSSLGMEKFSGNGGNCRAPLPLGSTFLQAKVITDPPQPEVCSGAVVHIIKDPKTKKLRKAKPTDPPIGITDDTPGSKPAKPAPVKKPPPTKVAPKKPCPACGIGCPHGMPSREVDENGCTRCACEDFMGPTKVGPTKAP